MRLFGRQTTAWVVGVTRTGARRHTGVMNRDLIRGLLDHPPDLPAVAGLPALIAAVDRVGAAVLQAPPGTGKTTMVPPALALARAPGRVIVTAPRRIAARAAARRLAGLLGEPVGGTVGYSVRNERRTSAATRVEFVTTGVLVRRLQRDPELAGVAAVVLDEVHERHLDGDLALALLIDVRTHLRDDLVLVAMSATIEAARTAALLGGPAGPVPVVEVAGALHPVDVRWWPPPARLTRTDLRGVTPAFLDHVATVTHTALADDPGGTSGDVLVFVPGTREIEGVTRRLAGVDADVRPLHGRLGHREQDLALTPGPRRRVVVSTAVAESSLTVPGVRLVVDAGLAREPRTDLRRGLASLVTVNVSRAGAEQRAGRAGREGPGVVHRCWSVADHARLPAHPEPEIAVADLTAFALELACWGSPGGGDLALMDPPPAAAMQVATAVLRGLGAVHEDGTVSARGRAIAAVGADPRLARALLDGARLVGSQRAAEVVGLLADDTRAPGGDLVAALREARRGARTTPWAVEVRRLAALVDRAVGSQALGDDLAVGLVVALAHPDRIARRRPGGSTYLMTSGTGAALPPGASALAGQTWLAVADADRGVGRADATVRSAAPLDEDLARLAAPALLSEQDEVRWAGSAVVARRSTRLGAIELAGAPIPDPPAAAVALAVGAGLAAEGLGLLPWPAAALALRKRMAFVHRTMGPPWPDVSDDALLAAADTWLAPDLVRVRTQRDLGRIDTTAALRRLLPWPEAAALDELAPEQVVVPSGSRVRVEYDGDQPVLSVRLQEVFGWTATPRVAGGRVPLLLHLLSPARRPVAVTSDLQSFWRGGYQQVRGELRHRYPKHSWPDEPAAATALRGVRPRGGPAPRSGHVG